MKVITPYITANELPTAGQLYRNTTIKISETDSGLRLVTGGKKVIDPITGKYQLIIAYGVLPKHYKHLPNAELHTKE